MKLIELKPEWYINEQGQRYLEFNCPKCDAGNCILALPVTDMSTSRMAEPYGWKWNGTLDFEKITLEPSIWHHCKSDPHFFIRDGEIIFA